MDKPIYFTSDIHLSPSTPQITQAFLRFCREAAKHARAVYILGDLFDVWIGDDHRSRYNQKILKALANLHDNGVETCLIVGNRDFLIGDDFCQQAKIHLLEDEYILHVAHQPILLSHGDQLCTDDVDYQDFRAESRTAAWRRETLAKPLWQRKLYGRYLRWKSQQAQKNKSDTIMDVNAEAVDAAFTRHGCQIMVHGHTHRPAEHQREGSTRWVLDAWHDHANHLELRNNAQQLDWKMIWTPFA